MNTPDCKSNSRLRGLRMLPTLHPTNFDFFRYSQEYAAASPTLASNKYKLFKR